MAGDGKVPGVMMGNPLAALCAASGPVDGLFVGSLLARDQMVLAMLGLMQPTASDTDLQLGLPGRCDEPTTGVGSAPSVATAWKHDGIGRDALAVPPPSLATDDIILSRRS